MNSLTKIAVGLALLLGMTSAGAGQVEHQRNEARAVVDEGTGLARLDVYDSFFVKEAEPKELASAVNLAVVDGFRQIAPTCADAKKLKAGDPRSTWVWLEHGPGQTAGTWKFALTRTVNFNDKDNAKTYRFTLRDGTAVKLDDGVYASLKDGRLVYNQQGGVIGPNGRKSLEFDYDLGKSRGQFAGAVKLDNAGWNFQVTKDRTAFTVNNKPIEGNYAGHQLASAGSSGNTAMTLANVVVTPYSAVANLGPAAMLASAEGVQANVVTRFPCNPTGCDYLADCQYFPTCKCNRMGSGLYVCGQ